MIFVPSQMQAYPQDPMESSVGSPGLVMRAMGGRDPSAPGTGVTSIPTRIPSPRFEEDANIVKASVGAKKPADKKSPQQQ